ncbi:MAG TPA: FAD-dependent oxidoreductase [Candidatus Babeliales bacterium]|nr:FAD-dependent oxidoreductase [Candidatus Babeliales bacterium]
MHMKYNYDVIVIGGGAAGLTAAKTAKGLGNRVALIEKMDRLGGECTWTGCIPSKTLIKAAEVAWQAQHLDMYGLKSQSLQIDSSNVMPSVRAVIQEDYQSHTPDTLKELGIDVLFGSASFIDRNSIDLDGRAISFSKAIIATGSSPFVPSIAGIDKVDYLTNHNLFSLDELPKSLIILGGGPIGCEMASALNRLGVDVQLVEMADRILPHEDEELIALLSDTMQQEGVRIRTGMKAIQVAHENGSIVLHVQDHREKVEILSAEKILIAVGRFPNNAELNLDAIGVKYDAKHIVTDATMRTSALNIYAAGDAVGPYRFSHMAWYQAVTAARNATIPFFKTKIDYTAVDWVTFTAPELARMGLTELQAREKYGKITVYRKPYCQLDRAITDRTTTGLAKYIVDAKGQLVGAHIFGARAGELLAELIMARMHGIPFYKISAFIHAYPTYSELNWHAAKKAYIDHLEKNIFIRMLKKVTGRS